MKSKRNGAIAIGALLIGTVVLLLLFCPSVTTEAVYPIEHVKVTFTRRVWFGLKGMFAGAKAGAENVRLKRRVAELSLMGVELERVEKENARLRRVLDYSKRHSEHWMAAAVLSERGGAAGVRDIIRVDRGSLAGVCKGAVVVVPDGLVGRVSAVSPHTSEITLVTDSMLKVACEIETGERERNRGILAGGNSDCLLLKNVRSGEGFRRYSKVVTSGLGGVFPRGIEVGTLLSITNGVRGVEGEVRPSVDYSTIEDVFIRRDS